MALHKIENGIRIDLSQEEEVKVIAQWSIDDQRFRDEILNRTTLKNSAIVKMTAMGFSQGEISQIIK